MITRRLGLLLPLKTKLLSIKESAKRAKERQRKLAQKFVAAALAVSMIFIATDAFGKEREGAKILVALKDGSQAKGELIAVRPASLLILDPAGKDLSINLVDINLIMVVRRSKAAGGALLGLLGGGLVGFLGGTVYAEAADLCPVCEAPIAELYFTQLGVIVGLSLGLIVGASAGHDLVFQIDGISESLLAASLDKLRKMARIKTVDRPVGL